MKHVLCRALALLLLSACSTEVANTGGKARQTPVGTGPNSTGTGIDPTTGLPLPVASTTDTSPIATGPRPGEPGPTALRRLTNDEYRNTVQDLLSLPMAPSDALQPETRSLGYDNFSAVLTVSGTLAGQYESLATKLADQADVASLAPCATPNDDTACALGFIQSFGKRALRRPLTSAEEQQYSNIYQQGRTGGSYEEGIRRLLQTFLASPKLVYRPELGTALATGGTQRSLTPYEVASALSYLFTGSTPDAELLAAADAQTLSTPAAVEAQARRLLASPRAKAVFRKFISEWFGLGKMSELSKDATVYPEFTPELRASMMAETDRFIDATVWERAGSIAKLVSAPSSFVDSRLSALYGVPNPGSDQLMSVELNPLERAGLLTSAAVLAVHSKAGDSFPIARGKFLRTGMLCQPLPDPPKGVVIVVPPPDPKLTTRERFAQHSSSPACASCHALIDPLGFGMENYDAIGRYRSMENGKPVDATGMLTGTPDADGPFQGGVELAAKLSSSRVLAECAGVQATRFAFGRGETDADRTLVASLAAGLGGANLDIRELLIALTKTENFFVRTAQP